MILADKIITLRKKQGWSQEEFAEKMDVSRQAVSKWEGGLSVPDLNKIIAMSALFGVSTDYLLKDEIEEVTPSETAQSDDDSHRTVSAEEAHRYLDTVERLSKRIAAGVLLCILSPVTLLLLLAFASSGAPVLISEGRAVGIGMLALFAFVAGAVAIFVPTGLRLSEFSYLDRECVTLEYGVKGIVEKKKATFQSQFYTSLTVGIVLCVCSALPLIILGAMNAKDFSLIAATALILVICSIGVALIVRVSYINGSHQRLLQTGEFTVENKKTARENEVTDTAYWCACAAIYLGVSFLTVAWHITWIVWPVCGCLFPVYQAIVRAARKREK